MQGTLIKGKSIKVSQSYIKPSNNSLHTAQHFDPSQYVASQQYQSATPPPNQVPQQTSLPAQQSQLYFYQNPTAQQVTQYAQYGMIPAQQGQVVAQQGQVVAQQGQVVAQQGQVGQSKPFQKLKKS